MEIKFHGLLVQIIYNLKLWEQFRHIFSTAF
jgi:hypothetical protein